MVNKNTYFKRMNPRDGCLEEIYRIELMNCNDLKIFLELHDKWSSLENHSHMYIGALIVNSIVVKEWLEDSLEDLAAFGEFVLLSLGNSINETIGREIGKVNH